MRFPYNTIENLNFDYSVSKRQAQDTSSRFVQQCTYCQSDGKYSTSPPYYELGPSPMPVCPYYNYVLPNVYPYVPTPPTDPRQYWYLPYETNGC